MSDLHDQASGEAYRKKLGRNSGFYRALCELVPRIEWQGCRIPLPKEINYGLDVRSPKNGFLFCVLERMGLPVYYVGDEEVYLKAGRCPDGSLMVAVFDIGLDSAEEIVLDVEDEVTSVEYLSGEGKRERVAFRREKGNVVVEHAMHMLDPVILFLK